MPPPRKWIGEHSAIVALVAVLVLGGSVVLIWWSRSGPSGAAPVRVYFLDLNTRELFAAPSTSIPAIAAPSDGAGATPLKGVRAFVFSCGDCRTEADRTIGWLETYSPEGQKKLAPLFGPNRPPNGPTNPDEMQGILDPGEHLVADAKEENWYDANSPEAGRIRRDAMNPCPSGERPRECRP